MNKLVNAVRTEQNRTALTENGALSNKSTLDNVLDFFGRGGALRNVSDQEVINVFSKAFSQDPMLTMRTVFYFRDVRGSGQGERRLFRVCMKWVADNHPEIFIKNIPNFQEFGRFDDLFCIF